MGYFMRFISEDASLLDFESLADVLRGLDARYILRPTDLNDLVEVLYDGQLYGQVEINPRGDELFDDDISAFLEMLGSPSTAGEQQVAQTLSAATQIIAVEMFWQGTNPEPTFEKFDPLWDWLFANRRGILQADTEGFYGAHGLLVERKFMI